MSTAEASAPTTVEPTTQSVGVAEEAPVIPAAIADKDSANPVAENLTVEATTADASSPEATEPSPAAEDGKADDDKKEKKHTRKPFADLLSKILKPHPHEKPASEKKDISDATAPAPEEVAVTSAPEVSADATEGVAEPSADATAVQETAKDVSSPRKERGNIFEKLTAFVMKPKSPKPKRPDAPKEECDEIPAVETNVEPHAPEDTSPASPVLAPVVEAAEPAPTDSAAVAETSDEPKLEKKEKTPKDLAKLARRFSGRLFGVEKKKDSAKRPEPTPEEADASPPEGVETANVNPDVAPQIPADASPVEPTSEPPQTATDSAPVIAAAA